MSLQCPILDTESYVILINGNSTLNTTHTKDSITISRLFAGVSVVKLFALDTYGLPILASFQLYFGLFSMPIHISFVNASAASGVLVILSLTDDPRMSQTGVTNNRGIVIFNNVPPSTVSVFARTDDNQIGLAGIAPSNNQINLTLIPFNSQVRSNELANQSYLNITTVGQQLQTISRTFMTESNSNEAYVEYQFVTSEVPGGYFGSVFNDYFSVTLRSEKGKYVTKTDSMNGLGLGAFDYITGTTKWNNLTLQLDSAAERIRFDIGVSNVADAAYQSSVIVRKYGSNQCANCENGCIQCTSDPMCRDVCTNPPLQSCAFYLNCMEEKVKCGSSGYALGYGLRYCIKFSKLLVSFSPEGQTWIWNTMNCLQKALVTSLKNCEKNCTILKKTAFDSHPMCYVDNGVCNLPPQDWAAIVTIVGKDLLNLDGFIQALKTTPQCVSTVLGKVRNQLQQTVTIQWRIILMVLEKWFQSL